MDDAPSRNPLDRFASGVHSQWGEDGILGRLVELLGITDGWCVELGAWDGIHLSNTYNLISNRGWRAVLVEADRRKFRELVRNMRPFPGVHCLRSRAGLEPPTDLDSLLAQTPIPAEFEILSIDVDGIDYHLWDDLRGYRPQVVLVEHNPTIPNHVEFVQARDPAVRHGSSLRSIAGLGEKKGYRLVSVTTSNAIFVRGDLFGQLSLPPLTLDELRPGHDLETNVLHLYDGTLLLHGNRQLGWHGIEMAPDRLQVLPRWLRVEPYSASRSMRLLQEGWRRLERWRAR